MNKNLLYLIAGIIIIILAFLLGWFIKPSPVIEPSVIVKTNTVIDTLISHDTTVVNETHILKDTIYVRPDKKSKWIADSVSGINNNVEYNILHKIKEDTSQWRITLNSMAKEITRYVTRDSLKTVVKKEYVSKHFLLDEWFYISVGEFALIVYLAIKTLGI